MGIDKSKLWRQNMDNNQLDWLQSNTQGRIGT